ncbi:trihelix transcription factor ASR3-like isoform X3 [Aristolochia californica]
MMMEVGGERSLEREYRKGNWTLHETLVLISAKKMDDERRLNRGSEREGRSKPTEQRWKWVEDYCWKNGCFRSQNQCNDKWDNLMRDYKKVREYERRVSEGGGISYWKMEKHERKERNLPTNLFPQIFEALIEVVERRGFQRVPTGLAVNKEREVGTPMSSSNPSSSVPPALQQHKSNPSLLPLPCPTPPVMHAPFSTDQALPPLGADSSDSDGSEFSSSPTKRRRMEETSTSSNTTHELRSAICKSASIIEKTLLECEEKEEKRQRELLSMEERKLKIEESKAEINLQAISGLTGAINQLANSIFALVSEKNQTGPK